MTARLASIDDFRAFTAAKLQHVACPHHGCRPRVDFHGERLADVTISIRSCCSALSSLANRAIVHGAAAVAADVK